MLREVISKHIKPRLIPVRGLLSSSQAASIMRYGYGDVDFLRTGAGAVTWTLKDGLTRNGMFFASLGTGGGGYLDIDDTVGKTTTFTSTFRDFDGSASSATYDGFFYGWDSSDANITKAQRVACTMNDARIVWGRVTGSSGAVAFGKGDFKVTRTTTGRYTIEYKRPFSTVPVLQITPISTSATAAPDLPSNSVTRNGYTIDIRLYDESSNAIDMDFYIVAIGQDSRSDSGKNRNPLFNSQRKPRIVAGQVINTGGAWTWAAGGSTGGADFSTTITDNGAGDFTVTLSELYKREPAILVSTTGQRAMIHSYSNGAIRVLTKAADGTNTDVNGVTNIFVIGTDDVSEY